MERGLIFDCDGVLADTELHGHLVAFNQMWKKLGVPWQWSPEQYAEKLKIGGGKERMASLFADTNFQQVFVVPESAEVRKALIATWHKEKTAIYQDRGFPKRPPVGRCRRHSGCGHNKLVYKG